MRPQFPASRLAAIDALGLLAAGCGGGGGSPRVASASSATTTTTTAPQNGLVAFAACIR